MERTADSARDELARVLTKQLTARDDIAAAWLYGSRAVGASRPSSDVDVGVVFTSPRPRTLDGLPVDVQDALEAALRVAGLFDGTHRPLRVDVVDLEHASCDLVHRVLRDGLLLCDRVPLRRVAVETRRRAEYFDMAPIRAEYRRFNPGGV